jgi:hypothetical protein
MDGTAHFVFSESFGRFPRIFSLPLQLSFARLIQAR